MTGFKNPLYQRCLILAVFLLLVSCSSFRLTKKAESPEGTSPSADQLQISALETELAGIQKDQTALEVAMQAKEAEIQTLKTTVQKLEKKITAAGKNQIETGSISDPIYRAGGSV